MLGRLILGTAAIALFLVAAIALVGVALAVAESRDVTATVLWLFGELGRWLNDNILVHVIGPSGTA